MGTGTAYGPRPCHSTWFQAILRLPLRAGIVALLAVPLTTGFGCSYGTSQSDMMKRAVRGRRDVEDEEPVTPVTSRPASAAASNAAEVKPEKAPATSDGTTVAKNDPPETHAAPGAATPPAGAPPAGAPPTVASSTGEAPSSSPGPLVIPDSGAAPDVPTATAGSPQPASGATASAPSQLTPVTPPEKPLTEVERRQRTVENLTKIAEAFTKYLEKNKQLPTRGIGKPQRPLLSWRVELLPYLGHEALHQQFKLNEPWNSEHNQKLLPLIPPVYQSPDRFDDKTNYLVPTGQGTAFFGSNTFKSHIEDGLESTILLMEVDDSLAVPWTKPSDYRATQVDPRRGLGELRKDGFFAIWADGFVTRIRQDVPLASLWAAYTIDAGDSVFRDSISIPADEDLQVAEVERAEELRKAAEKEGIVPADSSGGGSGSQTARAGQPGRRGSGPSLVPSAEAQRHAEAQFREIYREEYQKAKTKDDRQKLAKKLLGEATQLKDDPAGQYVLLRITRTIAAESGDLPTAIGAIGHTVRIFGVDDYDMKVEAIEAASKSPRPKVGASSEEAAIAREAEELIDRAVAADDYEVATKMHALAAGRKRGKKREKIDKKELSETADRRKEIEAARIAYQKVKHLIDALGDNPDDPHANLVAGKYYCLLKGQWDRGLPLLERSQDGTLVALSQLERARPNKPELQIQLADSWWELADQDKEEYSKQMQLRAVYWYLQSLPQLKQDLLRVKADLRVKAAEEEHGREDVDKLRTKLWGGRAMDRES